METYQAQAHSYGGGPGSLDPCTFPLKDKVPFSAHKIFL